MHSNTETLLNTASLYTPNDWVGQVYRVSRQHPRGRKAQWECLPFLYPDLNLFRAYRSGDVDFSGLAEQYRQGLEEKYGQLSALYDWVESVPSLGNFTLLCFEAAGEPCHRQVLAQWLLEQVPGPQAGSLR